MLRRFYFFLAALAFLAGASPSQAQVFIVATCGTVPTSQATLTAGNPGMLFIDNTGKLCTAASVSASITGFTPATTGTPIAVTTSGVTGTLPVGAVVTAFNAGATNTAFCKLGASATTSDIAIPPASWFAYTVGAATQLTCITSTSTTTVNMVGGSGLPTGAGGGGGGGAGGSVTQGTSPWVTAPGLTASTLSAWSSGTAGNTTQPLMSSGGWPAITVQLNQTSTISGGAVTFEGTYDGTNWVTIPVAQILNTNTLANLTNPYTLVQSTNQPFLILTQGYQQVRVRLSTVITGSGTVTPFVALLPFNPTLSALLNPLAAGSAIIGQVGINQTTPGTTNGVTIAPDSGTVTGLTPVVAGTTASNAVAKASAGNLLNAYVTSSAAGWVFLINATSLPGNATLTIGTGSGNLQGCFELQKGVTDWQASINYNPGPWEQFSTGIVVAISSTDCPVLTAASTGKFIHALAK